ncbi:heme A synthase [Alcanivorax sp. 1008]|uniref:COX15/CtaA family protein n=1 Tax=Alcanivorax sp. 1008 TaxID=2816853 RepID=UPI001DFBA117|nr:COX15/CtaA family protein [Alcanivorax sp. 1008]MCC1496503.1 COX15/CtaA family protein [Alcanivorax sp. 1008]
MQDSAPNTALRWQRRLTLVTIVMTAVVIMLGAWTRLADAGLGCPDWPGCYGHLDVRKAISYVSERNAAEPGTYREAFKTVPEMVHRYFASSLGLLILIITVLAWRNRRAADQPLWLPNLLLVIVICQGILGKLTVTMGLQPTIVMLHLLGGFTTMTLLCWLAAKLYNWPKFLNDCDVRSLRGLSAAAITVVVLQIALGGWTTANYAAVVCTELPICEEGWQDHINFSDAFIFWGHEHDKPDYEFGVLANDARTTIHVMHRFGALLVLLVVGALVIRILRNARCHFYRNFALTIGGLLIWQICLGLGNIIFKVPLLMAVAHNFFALVLLVSLVLFGRAIRVPVGRDA